MNFYDPLILITKALELTRYSVAGNPWSTRLPDPVLVDDILRTTPGVCANVTTPIDLGICIDAYCSHQSQHGTVHPDVDLKSLQGVLQGALKSPGISGLPQRAVIGKILDTYRDQLCNDQPPPPGATVLLLTSVPAQVDRSDEAPIRSSNCGYAATLPPETKPGWWLVLGGFLGILAFRAAQTATGAFFLFFEPEKDISRPNIT